MPPWASWWQGRETIAGFASAAQEFCAAARTVPTRANGQPAVAYYQHDEEAGRYRPFAIDVLTLDGSRIKEITAFIASDVFSRFDLPAELE
jgi:RNA polymerase sigma-70 factor, ECF subfamily